MEPCWTKSDIQTTEERAIREKSPWDHVDLIEINNLISQLVSRNGQFHLLPGMKLKEAHIAILSALTKMEQRIKGLERDLKK